MEEELFRKIIAELEEMDFDGRVSYHFYGEPMIDTRLPEFVRFTKERLPKSFTEIYSNGDYLTLEKFRMYLELGLDNFLITQHDSIMTSPLQEIMDKSTDEEKARITIRMAKDRNLINRSGLITSLQIVNEPLKSPCDWPLNIMVITLSGNVVLCCNDYFETEVIGNVADSSLKEVWLNDKFVQFREALSRGDRTVSKLCRDCDYVPAPSKLARIVPGG
jgi:radical SAM protein with 4Fe4S-binding SPASM domain